MDAVASVDATLESDDIDSVKRSFVIKDAVNVFLATPFGNAANLSLLNDGFVNIPYFKYDLEARYLEELRRAVDLTKEVLLASRAPAGAIDIGNEGRMSIGVARMVDKEGVVRKISEEMARTMRAVILALDGEMIDMGAVSLHEAMVANKEFTDWQGWHRDQDASAVARSLEGKKRSRARKPSRTYSVVSAFQSDTVLGVVRGSHRTGLTDFKNAESHDHGIPPGWGVLFHSVLVHRGMRSDDRHVRGHMYVAGKSSSWPEVGKIDRTVEGPTKLKCL